MNTKIDNKSPSSEARKPNWSERFSLLTDYFVNSDEKLVAWLMLAGILFSVVSMVGLISLLGWLSTGIWAALTANSVTAFFVSLGEFAAALVGLTLLKGFQEFLSGKLAINWRNWLSNKIETQLFKDKTFLKVKRTSDISDISQRIQEDVPDFVDLSLSLGTEFVNSTLTLIVSIGTLWAMGGALSFVFLGLNIVIPGYLVWVAILTAATASLITYSLGKSLPQLNQNELKAKGLFRQHLETVNSEGENIALEQTESYHNQILTGDRVKIQDTANQKLGVQTLLKGFTSFYNSFSVVVPYLLSAPLYFAGRIGLEQIGQVGMSFGQVSLALNWFAESYEKISTCQTKMDRVIGIYHAIEDSEVKANPRGIILKFKESTSIVMKKLTIQKPSRSNAHSMMRDLNLELKKGEHTLILGNSGLGKSTLFKVIRGTWEYGSGKIKLPIGQSLFFLSQKPTVVNDTLMAMLASPKPSSAYTKDQYLEVMHLIRYLDELIPDLETKKDWSYLSGGQKQMIAFARALLQKPDWLFLDEISASLDEDAEQYLYKLLKEQLPDTTIVSIAHRSTVKAHHDRVIRFGCPRETNVMEVVSDERMGLVGLG